MNLERIYVTSMITLTDRLIMQFIPEFEQIEHLFTADIYLQVIYTPE